MSAWLVVLMEHREGAGASSPGQMRCISAYLQEEISWGTFVISSTADREAHRGELANLPEMLRRAERTAAVAAGRVLFSNGEKWGKISHMILDWTNWTFWLIALGLVAFGFCLRYLYEQWRFRKFRNEVRDEVREVHDLTRSLQAATERLNKANADTEAAGHGERDRPPR